jgi:outer membrane protein OmpA-like peptidoglycan-associated protein
MRPVLYVALFGLAACAIPTRVKENLDRTSETIAAAHKVYAPLCAPRELANAQAHMDFTRIELSQGYVRRAGEHIEIAYDAAVRALEIATPCGGVDQDTDTIPDIVDVCPAEPEDFDGDNDEDGCPETSEDSDGDGIINAVDQCPDQAEDLDGFKDSDGCPDDDNDEDGVADIRDQCALIAEDRDDWDDEDGCPDPDNDLDGIPDVHDQCPNEPGTRDREGCPEQDADKDGIADMHDRCPDQPETANNYLDEDGCPDTPPSGVKVTRTRVEIKETIQFETGSATLLPASFKILDDVYQVLVDAPYLRLRIEGHTDSEGGDGSNLRLSNERAQSVRVYLESKGVAANRLTSVGYGESRPIDTNRTASGRAANRRVEFHILKDGQASP